MNKIKKMILGLASALAWLPPLLARLVIGAVFVPTGWGKLHNLDKIIEFFRSLGIPKPEIQAPFVASVELIFGALVLLGLGTRLAVVPLTGVMAVAILTAKLKQFTGPLDLFGTQEFDYLVMFALIFVFGPGPVSIDQFVCKECAGTCKTEPAR